MKGQKIGQLKNVVFVLGLSMVFSVACSKQEMNIVEDMPTPQSTTLSLVLVTPKRAPVEGGIVVRLQGSGFQEGVQVFFGEKQSSDITINSAKELQVMVPPNPNAFGETPIRVVNPDQSTITSRNIFFYFNKNVVFRSDDVNQKVKKITTMISSNYLSSLAYNTIVADFDQDHKPDLVVSAQGVQPITLGGKGALQTCVSDKCFMGVWKILFGNGSEKDYFLGDEAGSNPLTLAALDADRDGELDLLFGSPAVDQQLTDGTIGKSANVALILKMQSDKKLFVPMRKTSMGLPSPIQLLYPPKYITAGQFRTKGIWDFVSIGSDMMGRGFAHMYSSLKDGLVSTVEMLPLTGVPIVSLATDMNQDGLDDLIIADENYTLSLFMGQSGQPFASPKTETIGVTPSSITAGDFNEDGFVDIAVSDREQHIISIFWQKSDNKFEKQQLYLANEQRPIALTTGDINGDGLADIVVAFRSPNDKPNDKNVINQILILVNQGGKVFSQVMAPYKLDSSLNWLQSNPVAPAQPQAVVFFSPNQEKKPGLAVVDPRGYLVTLPNRSY